MKKRSNALSFYRLIIDIIFDMKLNNVSKILHKSYTFSDENVISI